MLSAVIPVRSADDFVAGIIRVRLGDEEVILHELPMDAMDAWADRVDRDLADVLRKVSDGDAEEVTAELVAARPRMLEALCRYPGVPPAEQLRATATHSEVLQALMGVWSAANPLVATLVEALLALSSARTSNDGGVSELMSTLLHSSDGPGSGSDPSSPTASSSPEPTSSTTAEPNATRRRSKPRGSGSSSPTTSRPTADGSGPSTRHRGVRPADSPGNDWSEP